MIVLYSNHCPRCEILLTKLQNSGVEFTVQDNIDVLTEKGFDFMPVLEVDGKCLNFIEANAYINSLRKE